MPHNFSRAGRKMRLLPLVAATFFMVSGGPYAIEDILGGAGYVRAIVLLLVLPFIWSLPTALMIGELAAAIPEEGGFYVWVRRAMGPFWGFQESWLSLTASIFDMAIYPAFAVTYLSRLHPWFATGWHGYVCSLAIVAVCCLWNLRGAPAVGDGSMAMSVALLAPFAMLVILGLWKGFAAHPPASSAHTSALEPAHGVHDRRAFQRSACRGRLLRLGAPRDGQFLGIPGSVAVAGRQYL